MLDQALLGWLDEVPTPAIELGIGDRPDTVMEWFARLEGPCIAVDHDPTRVRIAQEAGVDARVGTEDLGFSAGLIRAVNVFREVFWDRSRIERLNQWLRPGGLMVEATTDKPGYVVAARLWGPDMTDRGWLFGWDGQHGFHPHMFRGQVPRWQREVLERFDALESFDTPAGHAGWVPPAPGP